MRVNSNQYVFVDNHVEIHTKKGEAILIDKDDFARVKTHCWFVDSKGYVCGPRIRLHRFLMQPPKGMQVDHINRNKLDNRKCNLRIVTNQQNHFNRPINKNNKSGCTGVSYNKVCKKWCCQISRDGKCQYSGLFDTKEEAVAKRKSLEAIYFIVKKETTQ